MSEQNKYYDPNMYNRGRYHVDFNKLAQQYPDVFNAVVTQATMQDNVSLIVGNVARVEVSMANVGGESKKVANVTLATSLSERRIAAEFSPEFGDSEGTVWIDIAFWNSLADQVEKMKIEKGSKVMILAGNFIDAAYTGRDGTLRHQLRGTAFDFPRFYPTPNRARNNAETPAAPAYPDAPAAPAAPVAAPGGQFICADCGAVVNDAVASYSMKNYGRYLCRNCQTKAKQATARTGTTDPNVNQGGVCEVCGAPVDARVKSYSQRTFGGRCLCRNCQNGARNNTPAPAPSPAAPVNPYAPDPMFEEIMDGLDEGNPFV